MSLDEGHPPHHRGQFPAAKRELAEALMASAESEAAAGTVTPAQRAEDKVRRAAMFHIRATLDVETPVIPANAGIHLLEGRAPDECRRTLKQWIPAFAGMTRMGSARRRLHQHRDPKNHSQLLGG